MCMSKITYVMSKYPAPKIFGRAALLWSWVYFNHTLKKFEVCMFVVFLFSIFRSHMLNHGRKEAGKRRAKQGCAEG